MQDAVVLLRLPVLNRQNHLCVAPARCCTIRILTTNTFDRYNRTEVDSGKRPNVLGVTLRDKRGNDNCAGRLTTDAELQSQFSPEYGRFCYSVQFSLDRTTICFQSLGHPDQSFGNGCL